jgi:hypothetical protein
MGLFYSIVFSQLISFFSFVLQFYLQHAQACLCCKSIPAMRSALNLGEEEDATATGEAGATERAQAGDDDASMPRPLPLPLPLPATEEAGADADAGGSAAAPAPSAPTAPAAPPRSLFGSLTNSANNMSNNNLGGGGSARVSMPPLAELRNQNSVSVLPEAQVISRM